MGKYNAEYQKAWESRNKDRRREINRKSVRRKQVWYQSIKRQLSCVICGEQEPCCLCFHHLDPSQKVNEVSKMANSLSYSKKRILAEISKCAVLCHNCHAKVTAGLVSIDSDAATL